MLAQIPFLIHCNSHFPLFLVEMLCWDHFKSNTKLGYVTSTASLLFSRSINLSKKKLINLLWQGLFLSNPHWLFTIFVIVWVVIVYSSVCCLLGYWRYIYFASFSKIGWYIYPLLIMGRLLQIVLVLEYID